MRVTIETNEGIDKKGRQYATITGTELILLGSPKAIKKVFKSKVRKKKLIVATNGKHYAELEIPVLGINSGKQIEIKTTKGNRDGTTYDINSDSINPFSEYTLSDLKTIPALIDKALRAYKKIKSLLKKTYKIDTITGDLIK